MTAPTPPTPVSNNIVISHGKPQDRSQECGCRHYLTIRQHDLKKLLRSFYTQKLIKLCKHK